MIKIVKRHCDGKIIRQAGKIVRCDTKAPMNSSTLGLPWNWTLTKTAGTWGSQLLYANAYGVSSVPVGNMPSGFDDHDGKIGNPIAVDSFVAFFGRNRETSTSWTAQLEWHVIACAGVVFTPWLSLSGYIGSSTNTNIDWSVSIDSNVIGSGTQSITSANVEHTLLNGPTYEKVYCGPVKFLLTFSAYGGTKANGVAWFSANQS